MRILSIILALSCLCYINGELKLTCEHSYFTENGSYVYEYTVNSASDCNNRLSADEKKEGDVCCYSYYSKSSKYKSCEKLDKYEFKNFNKYWKKQKLYEEAEKLDSEIYKDMPASERDEDYDEDLGDYHLDCYSDYIKLTLFSILLFLI